jgi:hypothetical protein
MATIKKFIATSNGNRVFVSDLAAMADTIFGMMGAWPCPIPYCILKGVIGPQNTSMRINKGGGVLMHGKFFPTPNGDTLSIPKGSYLYAKAQNDTAEPRTSSTGQSYYQNIVYSLMVTTAKQTGTSTDYEAETGLWEIVDGAVTRAMETLEWIAYVKSSSTLWRWDYIDNNLPANIVQTQAVADAAITTPKMAPGAVTNAILAPGAVTLNKLAFSVGMPYLPSYRLTIKDTTVHATPWAWLVIEASNQARNIIITTEIPPSSEGAPIKIVVSNKTNFGLSLTLTQPNDITTYLINIPSQTILIVDGVWMRNSYSFVTYDGKNTYP